MGNEAIHHGSDDPMTIKDQEAISERMQPIFEEASKVIPNLQDGASEPTYLTSTSGLLRLIKYDGTIYITGASSDNTKQLAEQLANLVENRMGLEIKIY